MAEYRHDFAGFGAFLRSAGMQQAMKSVAEEIQAKAIASSPDGPTLPGEPGKYRESFEIEVGLTADGERAQATVRNTSDHAAAVEFGTIHQHAQRILGRAAEI